MVLGRRELVRIPSQEVDRIRAPRGQENAERGEEHRVPAQEAPGRRRGVRRPHGERHEEPGQDEEGRDDRDGAAVPVLHGTGLAPPRPVPRGIREVFRGGRSEQEQAEDRSDGPGLRGERRGHERPAGDLEKAPPGNRDRDVRPHPEAFRAPEGRHGVDQRREEPSEKQEKALMVEEGRADPREEPRSRGHDDRPGGHEGEDREQPRQTPRRRDGHLARDERAIGLVDAVHFEVRDLVEDVRSRVEERRAERPERDDPQQLPCDFARGVVHASERADGARENAEERRQERERAREARRESEVHETALAAARRVGAAAAPARVFRKFRTWPFETRQGAPARPSRLSRTVPRQAASTTATAPRAVRRAVANPAAARTAAAARPASVPATETAPSVPGGTRRKSGRSAVGDAIAWPISVPTVSMSAVASAAAAASRKTSPSGASPATRAQNAGTATFARTFSAPRRPPLSSAFPIASLRAFRKRVANVPTPKNRQSRR